MQGYHNSREHLFEELHRLDLLLNLQITRQRHNPAYANFNEFRGLFISEKEIDLILGEKWKKSEGDTAEGESEIRMLLSAIEQLEEQIARKTATALAGDVHLSLPRLARLFHLTPFDVDALLICVALELDLKYEKLYAYLQNDATRKSSSMDLILNILCRSLEEKVQARTRLNPEAPLMKYHLLTHPNDGHNEHASALSRSLKIDERILNYLLALDTMDEQLSLFAKMVIPCVSLGELLLPSDLKENLVRLFQSQMTPPDPNERGSAQVFLFHGPPGVGKKFTAEALCQSVGINLLITDVPQMLSNGLTDISLVQRLFREAGLQSTAVYLDNAEVLLAENEKANHAKLVLFKVLEEFPLIVFIGSEQAWDSQPQTESFFKVEFPTPTYSLRKQLWQKFLTHSGYTVSQKLNLNDFEDKFNFTAGKIRNAISEAKHLAMMRSQAAPEISSEDLYQACRAQSTTKLTTLARKITPLYTWEDIILPNTRLQQLKEICIHAKYRQQVFGQWGFDRKISLGKGLSILFIGQSGTGKTMAAEIIADELCLDLYKIDLSGVVSKYIGETEKNLNKIFQEAEQSNAILFFDEADAIFGKRSEVKDSHDRYANIEINYLLQKMEEYEGITILASNFQKNIDEAFIRRLRFIVEFPFPDEEYRYRIWKRIFPENTPLNDDLDFDFLAKKLKITGGNIKNIALNSAFLAASDSGMIRMEHIIRSTQREFQKMGRLCVKADFEQYFDWLEENDER